jgi:ribulose-5-phosphate 4-epimerase/fuculose-1-phosphate aldolase
MNKVLIVGGTFDKEGGRPSKLIYKIYEEFKKASSYEVTYANGGWVSTLRNGILPDVINYNVVLWFANVSNEEDKLRDVKAINPKCILVTSKRNDDNKYTFAELISRALAIKANLTIEFSKQEYKFNMMLFDPLGNVFYDGFDVAEMCDYLMQRVSQLQHFTRVSTVQEIVLPAPEVPNESEFFEFAHDCADIFHNLIRPAKGTERFLGNMSFRCQNGFPSFRGENGIIYVSRRNVDKSDINTGSFVPTFLTEDNTTKYFGDHKPSVDTPVQLRLYKMFPWANYMLHAHCYVDITGIPGAMMLDTQKPVPCGAIEEVDEIYNAIPKTVNDYTGTIQLFNKNAPRLLAINLTGHGCLLIAKDVEIFKELQKHKDNCFVQRPTPEYFRTVIPKYYK